MFNILKFRKTVKLDCYTARPDVYSHASIAPSSKCLPSWFKSLPKTGKYDMPNMKGCPGFIDLYKSGFILPMWSDLKITLGGEDTTEYSWQYADTTSEAHVHPEEQRGSFAPPKEFAHLKLQSPWAFECDTDIKWLFIQNAWGMENLPEVIIPPGAVSYYYQLATNVNMLIRKKKEASEVVIPYLTPLVHIVPLTEKEVIFETHLISQEELGEKFGASCGLPTTFSGGYRTKVAQIQRGCPFHKG